MTNTGRYVELGETVSVSAHNVLKGRDDVEETTAVGEAADWLADLLGAGPVPAAEVFSAAKKAGISVASIRRAGHGRHQVRAMGAPG